MQKLRDTSSPSPFRRINRVSVISTALTILFWIAVILIILLVYIFVVAKVIRRFVKFPAPAFCTRLIDNPIRRRIQSPPKVVGWIDVRKGMHVLEIGPGSGTYTIEVAKQVGKTGRVFAVDIQSKVISKLNSRLQRERITNVETKVASAYELPLQNNSVDRVFMIAVLAEIPNTKRALLEIKRVLKSDGLLAVGELLPDPDYPRRKTVVRWCKDAGFKLVNNYGGILHYLLTFRPI